MTKARAIASFNEDDKAFLALEREVATAAESLAEAADRFKEALAALHQFRREKRDLK